MRSVNVGELKDHLSRYLRAAHEGDRIVVLDRREPVAELGPPPWVGGSDAWKRLEREGKVRLGSQDWHSLRVRPLPRRVRIRDLLDEVRGES